MSPDKGKETNVLADKQKFGRDERGEKLEHEAQDKLAHMGERTEQAQKAGSPGKQ